MSRIYPITIQDGNRLRIRYRTVINEGIARSTVGPINNTELENSILAILCVLNVVIKEIFI